MGHLQAMERNEMNTFRRLLGIALVFGMLTAAGIAAAEPLHLYLTYSDDPVTTIDINLCIKEIVPEVNVYIDTVSRNGEKEQYAQCVKAAYRQTMLEIYDRRAMYIAPLKGLKPGTVYYFMAGDDKYGYSKERSFRTLPGGDAPIQFIAGGDMGISPRTIKLLKLAGAKEPDFAVIGGDIPYSNALFAEYHDWEEWFENWDRFMNKQDGRMVPIVAAIGNHEVNRYVSDNPALRSPDFFSLFGQQGNGTYFSLRFSDDVVFFVLDSGHIAPHDGAQAAWLDQEFQKYQNVKYKFATYHVPLYPSHRPYDGQPSENGRKFWGPLFDKYGLTVGFEQHDHTFKRSKPLKANEVVEKGTVYVGDGAFGVDPREVDPQPRWYNEKEGQYAHFWFVEVEHEKVSLKAIAETGVTIDAFTLP